MFAKVLSENICSLHSNNCLVHKHNLTDVFFEIYEVLKTWRCFNLFSRSQFFHIIFQKKDLFIEKHFYTKHCFHIIFQKRKASYSRNFFIENNNFFAPPFRRKLLLFEKSFYRKQLYTCHLKGIGLC